MADELIPTPQQLDDLVKFFGPMPELPPLLRAMLVEADDLHLHLGPEASQFIVDDLPHPKPPPPNCRCVVEFEDGSDA